jgi:hypothetical protein
MSILPVGDGTRPSLQSKHRQNANTDKGEEIAGREVRRPNAADNNADLPAADLPAETTPRRLPAQTVELAPTERPEVALDVIKFGDAPPLFRVPFDSLRSLRTSGRVRPGAGLVRRSAEREGGCG